MNLMETLRTQNIKSSAGIAASKLDLSSISQAITFSNTVTMNSKILKMAKGIDVASGTSITLGEDGNFFDITGTTTIQTITAKQAGTVVWLQFDGTLTLTHSTGNLELLSDMGVDAGDCVCLVCDGTNWVLAGSTQLAISSQVQGDVLYHNGARWTRLGPGTSGYFLKTQGAAANPVWAEAVSDAVTGSILNISADTEQTTTSASYIKSKEIYIGVPGTYSVSFDLRRDSAQTAQGRIYVNGSPVGTERSNATGSYVTYTEDISVVRGDLLQLYHLITFGSDTSYVRNFRVSENEPNHNIVITD